LVAGGAGGFLCGCACGLGTHSQRLRRLVPGGHTAWVLAPGDVLAPDGVFTTVVVVITVTSSRWWPAAVCALAAAAPGRTPANSPANASHHDARPVHDLTSRRSPSTARHQGDCQVESHACSSGGTERRTSPELPRRRRTVTETPPGVNLVRNGFTTETRVPDVLIKTVTKLRAAGTATRSRGDGLMVPAGDRKYRQEPLSTSLTVTVKSRVETSRKGASRIVHRLPTPRSRRSHLRADRQQGRSSQRETGLVIEGQCH
jgi:hypothetical protein